MIKLVAALAGVAAFGALLYFTFAAPSAPPEVSFAAATRQALVSTIVTNGKIEPSGYVAVHASREGALQLRLTAERGQRVTAGQVLATIDAPGFDAELRAAESAISQAQSELAVIEKGGSASGRTDIDNSLAATRLELEAARRERDKTARLVEKQAETQETLTAANDRVRQLEARIEALTRSRAALLPDGGKAPVQARLREAEATRASVEQRMAQSIVRAPVAGIVFNVAVKPGAFVHPGYLIAEIGRAGSANAVIYVDEPELGRVAKGMRVKITWDALPDREWTAEVERMPAQIVALNSRQVGEVICRLPNQDGTLPPGANINAEIISREIAGALAIPKAALRRQGTATGVLVLKRPENKLEWRAVEVGISSITHAAIDHGLQDGDLVALPGEATVAAGQTVTPKLP